MLNTPLKAAAAAILSLCLVNADAATQHEGDIQPWLEAGKIQVNGSLFEADFGDLPGGPYRTDDPGYDADTDKGAFTSGNWLWLEGLGTLKFWDGSSWGTPLAGETVRIDDALGDSTDPGDDTIFAASGVTKAQGIIGELAGGDLHEHLDMALRDAAGSLGGSIGAYWITLRLFETAPNSNVAVSTPSDAFSIVFNRGLTSEAFESAVAATAVPVPAAVYLLGSALASIGLIGRRRSPAVAAS